MGPAEIEFQIIPKRNLLGKLRFNIRISDTLNHKILFASNQGYSRRIDALQAMSLVQRYAAVADIREVEK